MAIIGQGISLRGMTHNDFHYPFNLASGITQADVGKAVALDATSANQVKLAGDGDQVVGVLVTVEDRTVEGVLVGTVALRGGFKVKEVDTPAFPLAVGDSAIGAGAGEVKARLNAGASAKEADHSDNMVVEVGLTGGYVIVVR